MIGALLSKYDARKIGYGYGYGYNYAYSYSYGENDQYSQTINAPGPGNEEA